MDHPVVTCVSQRRRERLRPLLELPIERVVVSHGEPVLAGGRDALAEALRIPTD